MTEYLPHEIANIFPLMTGAEFVQLKTDIKENGLREPIWLYEGKILDGRNRFRACQEVGVEIFTREYSGDDPVGFVISLNLQRRHLDESQRAMIAAELANMRLGDNQHTKQGAPIGAPTSQPEAANLLNVSRRAVQRATKVKNEGAEELQQAAKDGDVKVSVAADLAELPKEEQKEIIARGEKEILEKAKRIRSEKAIKRRKQIEALKASTPTPEFAGQYDVIVIDPPWPMQKIERDVRPNQVEFDYPTMSESELAEMDLPFSENSHVFQWTTHKFLPMALRLFDAWGVRYVFTMVWHKPGGFQPIGLPQYNCEFILYGKVGTPQFVDTKAFPTCFEAPRGKHSEKPDAFYDLIRRTTEGYRIDVFNRRRIEGFDVWGNEAVA